LGTYADKAVRLEQVADRLASLLEVPGNDVEACRLAASLCKNDLVTGTVGEFPELQGQVGGLLLEAEGRDPVAARGI
jgi:glycyl-tRNA synthetase beta chain